MKRLDVIVICILFSIISCSPKATQTPLSNKSLEVKSDYLGNYTISDKVYGTKVDVSINNNIRTIVSNGLPNHITGKFPNENNPNKISPQFKTYKLPLSPKYTGKPKFAREPGVALNGVKFEPGTAEVLVCQSGEEYRIEAIQDVVSLGLDDNNAHVQPQGAYHYHGISQNLINAFDNNQDLVLVGFAKDGFKIYYSKSNSYKPSYKLNQKNRNGNNCKHITPFTSNNIDIDNSIPDGTYTSDWKFVSGIGNLDECNGTEINGEYCYFITDEYPYISRCLMGQFKENHRRGALGKPDGPPPNGRPGPPATRGH